MLDLEEQISNMKIIHVAGTKGKVVSFYCCGLLVSWNWSYHENFNKFIYFFIRI